MLAAARQKRGPFSKKWPKPEKKTTDIKNKLRFGQTQLVFLALFLRKANYAW